MDFGETKKASPVKKISGIYNFNLMGSNLGRDLLKKQDNVELAVPNDSNNKQYSVGGIRMNIKDIMGLSRVDS